MSAAATVELQRTARLVICHKQATSARLRFFSLNGSILAFDPFEGEVRLHDEDYSPDIQVHPSAVVRQAQTRLGLSEGSIAPESGFQAWVHTDTGDVPVLLAVFETTDPPFEAAERLGARFIAMTDARSLNPLDQQLLRRVYEYVLG